MGEGLGCLKRCGRGLLFEEGMKGGGKMLGIGSGKGIEIMRSGEFRGVCIGLMRGVS